VPTDVFYVCGRPAASPTSNSGYRTDRRFYVSGCELSDQESAVKGSPGPVIFHLKSSQDRRNRVVVGKTVLPFCAATRGPIALMNAWRNTGTRYNSRGSRAGAPRPVFSLRRIDRRSYWSTYRRVRHADAVTRVEARFEEGFVQTDQLRRSWWPERGPGSRASL